MAVLTVQKVVQTGLAPTFVAADVAGDEYVFQPGVVLVVKNDDASPHTATITSNYTARAGTAAADVAVVIPAGEERYIGPLTSRDIYADGSGNVNITYDAVTSVTVAAIVVGG